MNIEILKVGPLQTNCYILSGKKKIVIIDPGGDANKIIDVVNKLKKGDMVVEIINTHYHYDHTLANNELRDFFKAKIYIHENEKNFIEFKADGFLKEGEEIEINGEKLKVINTPGHTKGSICLLGEDLIFTGDTIFEQGIGRTDFPGGNMEEMEESLKRLPKYLKEGMVAYPGHGNNFTYAV